MTTNEITLDHIDAGCRAAISARDSKPVDGHGYNQANWCGTSCCIWGHAVSAASLPLEAADGGPPPGWHPDIAGMLRSGATKPEQVLSRIHPDFKSAKTTRGNIGIGWTQEFADRQAAEMDENFCSGCSDCSGGTGI